MPIIPGELMEIIAQEAERQGFQVRQTAKTAWQFRKDGQNWFFAVREGQDVLDALGVLVSDAGLSWPSWDR